MEQWTDINGFSAKAIACTCRLFYKKNKQNLEDGVELFDIAGILYSRIIEHHKTCGHEYAGQITPQVKYLTRILKTELRVLDTVLKIKRTKKRTPTSDISEMIENLHDGGNLSYECGDNEDSYNRVVSVSDDNKHSIEAYYELLMEMLDPVDRLVLEKTPNQCSEVLGVTPRHICLRKKQLLKSIKYKLNAFKERGDSRKRVLGLFNFYGDSERKYASKMKFNKLNTGFLIRAWERLGIPTTHCGIISRQVASSAAIRSIFAGNIEDVTRTSAGYLTTKTLKRKDVARKKGKPNTWMKKLLRSKEGRLKAKEIYRRAYDKKKSTEEGRAKLREIWRNASARRKIKEESQ